MGPDGYDGLKMTDDKSLYNKTYYTTHYSPDDTSNAKVQDFIKSYRRPRRTPIRTPSPLWATTPCT